jgi:hypothetical protein
LTKRCYYLLKPTQLDHLFCFPILFVQTNSTSISTPTLLKPHLVSVQGVQLYGTTPGFGTRTRVPSPPYDSSRPIYIIEGPHFLFFFFFFNLISLLLFCPSSSILPSFFFSLAPLGFCASPHGFPRATSDWA